MAEVDGPKFRCPSCGREFRWRPELAGKKAKCKCGAAIEVPARPPAAPVAVEDDQDSYDVHDDVPPAPAPGRRAAAAAPPPPPPPPPPPMAPPPIQPQHIACPVCGTLALPTAILCQQCGYNFRTGGGGARGAAPARVPYASSSATQGGFSADTYQQAAKAAWVGPLIAFGLGCCTRSASSQMPAAGLVIAGFQLLLILGGTGCGIFALFGMKRHGPERIMLPAITGLVLNGIIIALNVILFTMLFKGTGPFRAPPGGGPPVFPGGGGGAGGGGTGSGAGSAAPRTPQQVQQDAQAAFEQDGWFGVLQHRGATITLVTVPDSAPLAAEIIGNFQTPVSVVVLGVDNSTGGDGFSIDPAGGTLHLTNGTTQPLPDVVTVLRTARTEREQAVRGFSPPFTVFPGRQLTGKFLFLPPKTDPRTIARITVKIDGQPVDIPGQFLTADEKRALQEAGGRRR